MDIIYEKYQACGDFQALFKLFKNAFPKSKHFICDAQRYSAYLKWLYLENPFGKPVGYNAYSNDMLVGHYVCIPCEWTQNSKIYRALLSVNTAVHPKFQGQGIFSVLAKKTYQTATNAQFDFVYAVSNQASTPGFHKMGFDILGPLNVHLSFSFQRLNHTYTKNPKKFTNTLSKNFLKWRMRRPFTNYQETGGRIISKPENLPLRIVSRINLDNNKIGVTAAKPALPLYVYIGTEVQQGMTMLPNWLRPTPLNLIYLPLKKSNIQIDNSADLWCLDFLDFDLA